MEVRSNLSILRNRFRGTSINIDSDNAKPSQTNGTAARKFAAPTAPSFTEVPVKNNADHIVEHGLGLKGLAVLAENIAAAARADLSTTRSVIAGSVASSIVDSRSIASSKTEDDRNAELSEVARNVADSSKNSLPGFDVDSLAQELIVDAHSSIILNKVGANRSTNHAVPRIDSLEVGIGKSTGTVDCFRSTMSFSLLQGEVQRLKLFKVFRSTLIGSTLSRTIPVLSMRGMEKISSLKNRSRSKSGDQLKNLEVDYKNAGVRTSLEVLNSFDPRVNLRVSSDAGAQPDPVVKSNLSTVPVLPPGVESFLDPGKYADLDRSVALDLKSAQNIRQLDPAAGIPGSVQQLTTEGARGVKGDLTSQVSVAGGNAIDVSRNNSEEFRQIAVISPRVSRIESGRVFFEFKDEGISFGRTYRYYVVSVDVDMVDSIRSEIVSTTIDGLRVPARPKSVVSQVDRGTVTLTSMVDDQLVEKFEIYRREESGVETVEILPVRLMSDVRGFNTSFGVSLKSLNGFIKVGESLSAGGSSTFRDVRCVPGRKYGYRVYSVDVFGNKSESPFEIDVFVVDKMARVNDLLKPSLTAETDQKTGKAKLTFSCADSRVKNLFLSRRDLTVGQKEFTTPGQVSALKFGKPKAAEGPYRFEDVISRGDSSTVWNGLFQNSGGEISFVDKIVSQDHIYQYKIYGVDHLGNLTPFEISKPFLVSTRPIVNVPINVVARISQGPNFTVGGVSLSWQEGNTQFSAEDQLGSRDKLSDNSVRTLYQVERKKLGEERWYEFPLSEKLDIFDSTESSVRAPLGSEAISGDARSPENPRFLPPLVQSGQTYTYRVKALQSGTFVSNYSDSVKVFAALPVQSPENFRIRFTDVRVKPFGVILNWDTPVNSGPVDKWEIERASVNNVAAAKINLMNVGDFSRLNFSKFREVFRESSRFVSSQLDAVTSIGEFGRRKNNTLSPSPNRQLTGQHFFQDVSVISGNTYFYRIRAVRIDGELSSWVYKAVRVTDQTTEDIINNFKKEPLGNLFVPIVTQTRLGENSFSIQPEFSKPSLQLAGSIAPGAVVPTPQPTFNAGSNQLSAETKSSILSNPAKIIK